MIISVLKDSKYVHVHTHIHTENNTCTWSVINTRIYEVTHTQKHEVLQTHSKCTKITTQLKNSPLPLFLKKKKKSTPPSHPGENFSRTKQE